MASFTDDSQHAEWAEKPVTSSPTSPNGVGQQKRPTDTHRQSETDRQLTV